MLDQRNKVILAVAGSVGLHMLVLLLWALTVQWLPQAQGIPPRTPDPIKLTIEASTPEPPLAPVVANTPPPVHFKDTADMPEADTPPPDARFQSAKNTVDASELPATGDEPMPTQEGRKIPSFVLNSREYLAGNEPGQSAPDDPPPPPAVATAPPLPRAAPPPSRPAPVAAASAAAAPAQAGDFALAQRAAIPTEPPVLDANPYDPSVRMPGSSTEPPRPTPAYAGRPHSSYQPQALKTAVSGSINNRGPASVASVASPLGHYQGAVIESIRRRWYAYVDKRSDIASMGSVTIHFLVGMDGRARATRVVANTANEALASLSLQAILDARIPPMPAEAVPDTGGGQLPMDLTFEFLDSSNF